MGVFASRLEYRGCSTNVSLDSGFAHCFNARDMRALLLVGLVLGFAAPAARANEAPDYLPVFTAADGVAVKGNAMTFSAKADKLYRTLAGRRAYTRLRCLHRQSRP